MGRRATALMAAAALAFSVFAAAQIPGRLVDAMDVTEQADHVDISLLFGCGLQYRGTVSATPNDVIRVRFAAASDCGDVSGALAPTTLLPDAAKYIRSVEWDRLAGTDLTLSIRLVKRQNFVLVPTSDGRGLRVRLLEAQQRQPKVEAGELESPVASYAVNLTSSQQPFDDATIAETSRSLGGVPVYVSTYVLAGTQEEQTWYRLRAGPFSSRANAEELLRTAKSRYPKAWLAIGDDTQMGPSTANDSVPGVRATVPRGAATLQPADAARLLDQARQELSRKNYTAAIPLLTQLLEQPEFPQRAAAQEMMGLTRERNRQLAHAKAEYEEYLRRYPNGPAAQRVRERLRALALATRAPGVSASAFGADDHAWKIYGGVAQYYRHDTSQLDNAAVSTNLVTQNAVLNNVDAVARKRGDRFDFAARVSGDYVKDLQSGGLNDRTRVSTFFMDLADRDHDWNARLGRQSQTTGGLFGTFDGVSGGWQLRPHLRVKAATGFPIELASDAPDTQRRFLAFATDFGTYAQAWDFSVYALAQQYHGLTDRQVLGAEAKYFRPGRTLVALTDYDLHYHALNSAFMLGSMELPGRWTLSANVDRRKSPTLSVRNALIGQPTTSFTTLTGLFTPQELAGLAFDRSADASLYDLSVARPFGERWQWTLDLAMYSIGSTPASGGVDATPDTGTDSAITLQGMAFSLFGGGDLSSIALRHQRGANQNVESLGLTTRFALWHKLRLGPSLRVDYRELLADGSTQWLYVPGLRLDLQSARFSFNLEAGTEIGRRQLGTTHENSTRRYVGVGYRVTF